MCGAVVCWLVLRFCLFLEYRFVELEKEVGGGFVLVERGGGRGCLGEAGSRGEG